MPLTFILAISDDPGLLESRSSILRSDGYAVEPVLTVEQAINRLENHDYDLVLLGHSIPAQERDYLTRLIRASGLLTPIVTVAPLTDPIPYEVADAVVEGSPEMLLSGIREVLVKARKGGNGSGTYRLRATADYPVEEAINYPCGPSPMMRLSQHCDGRPISLSPLPDRDRDARPGDDRI
jgi:CheY-like chemotaxis protein